MTTSFYGSSLIVGIMSTIESYCIIELMRLFVKLCKGKTYRHKTLRWQAHIPVLITSVPNNKCIFYTMDPSGSVWICSRTMTEIQHLWILKVMETMLSWQAVETQGHVFPSRHKSQPPLAPCRQPFTFICCTCCILAIVTVWELWFMLQHKSENSIKWKIHRYKIILFQRSFSLHDVKDCLMKIVIHRCVNCISWQWEVN